jgi:galactokinase
MYRIVDGLTEGLADVEGFIEALNRLDQHPVPEARALFGGEADLIVTRAPGRLDVMGGIADYSGSLVLELPAREATLVALQRDTLRTLTIVSTGAEANNRAAAFHMPLADFERGGAAADYETARKYFERDPKTHWAAYAAGALLVLMRERGVRFNEGARMLIHSSVPEGKGVSSSAALEVAVMQAVAAAFDLSIDPRQVALLCQKVENLVAGAPCGVMDQMTAACGETNRFLALLCQPAELQSMAELPEGLAVWGLDSGVRHSVSGADYSSVRAGAFMGYRMMAEMAGLVAEKWGGYLANVTPSEFEQRFAPRLPERMDGGDFLARYGSIADTVTRIEAGRSYAIRAPTAHPIYEHFRVRAFMEMLDRAPGAPRRELLGELMYQSHASYSACGLGSAGTDLLVDMVRAAGSGQGLYGAKITGGGSGGTVAVLGRGDAGAAIEAIAEQYGRATGDVPYIFSGSSPGAARFGHLRLRKN